MFTAWTFKVLCCTFGGPFAAAMNLWKKRSTTEWRIHDGMAHQGRETTPETLSATGHAGIEPYMTERKNRLTETEREAGRRIVESARHLISKAAKKDYSLLWALRRYVYTRLIYDERGTPMQRRSLKRKKIVSQRGLCAICKKKLPKLGAELDRRTAMRGYTEENTRLVHHKCHRRSQEEKGFV